MSGKATETIEAFVSAMATCAGEHNDAAENEDKGRGNKAMCLLVFDDGSGVWCEASFAMKWYREQGSKEDLLLYSQHQFQTPKEAARLMTEEMAELGESV